MDRFHFITGCSIFFLTFISATAAPVPPKPGPSPIPLPTPQRGPTVRIDNPPSLPVPVIRTDRLPIPPDLIQFQRNYCTTWEGPFDTNGEDATRKLVMYTAKIPTILFPNRVFWIGELEGDLIGPETNVQFARHGEVEVTDACTSGPPASAPGFEALLNTMTLNLYNIDDAEVRGFACEFDGIFPVDVRLRVPVLLYKDRDPSLPAFPIPEEGPGQICLKLTFIGGAGD